MKDIIQTLTVSEFKLDRRGPHLPYIVKFEQLPRRWYRLRDGGDKICTVVEGCPYRALRLLPPRPGQQFERFG